MVHGQSAMGKGFGTTVGCSWVSLYEVQKAPEMVISPQVIIDLHIDVVSVLHILSAKLVTVTLPMSANDHLQ